MFSKKIRWAEAQSTSAQAVALTSCRLLKLWLLPPVDFSAPPSCLFGATSGRTIPNVALIYPQRYASVNVTLRFWRFRGKRGFRIFRRFREFWRLREFWRFREFWRLRKFWRFRKFRFSCYLSLSRRLICFTSWSLVRFILTRMPMPTQKPITPPIYMP